MSTTELNRARTIAKLITDRMYERGHNPFGPDQHHKVWGTVVHNVVKRTVEDTGWHTRMVTAFKQD